MNKPIVYVDLDGTLSPTDLLLEAALRLIRKNVLYAYAMLAWVFKGAWYTKQQVFQRVNLDTNHLPIRIELLEHLKQLKSEGHEIVLASASRMQEVAGLAARLGIFDRVIASTDINLKGERKLQAMREDAAGRPFWYFGDARVDIPIWKAAERAYAVNPSHSVVVAAKVSGVDLLRFDVHKPSRAKAILKAMRPQQWAKNTLLFVPLLAAHESSSAAWLHVFGVFWAFGLVASSTYIWNDLMDLPADRQHPRKRFRPMASGDLGIMQAFVAMKALGLAGFVLAWLTAGWAVVGVLALYTLITLVYTFVLKRVAFVDVLVLGLLYTLRVIAGGVAAGLVVSNWLLALSLFMFLSLALVKRCAELEFLQAEGEEEPQGRGYRMSDLGYLVSMGISSGFMAVTVIALYVDSQAGSMLYSNPLYLWGICPVVLYWIMRIWILTSRREMIDDPVHFAIYDKISWCVAALVGLLVWLAK